MSDEIICFSFFRTKKCANGFCTDSGEFCDGMDHCRDRTDEILCTCESNRHGIEKLVTCPGGSNFTDCISALWMCDGHSDCPGGTDEADCPDEPIRSGKSITIVMPLCICEMQNSGSFFF